MNSTNGTDTPPLFILLSPRFYTLMIRFLVGVLMICLGLWLASGIVSLGYHLYLSLSQGWVHQAEKMIVDVVIIMAVLELVRTLQSYLELGRVKVTLILDAALVVLIGELISLWYRDYTTTEVLLSLAVIGLLTLLRIVTAKFSPETWTTE
jgi:uncharacterized membrane protein (DUF373 family)